MKTHIKNINVSTCFAVTGICLCVLTSCLFGGNNPPCDDYECNEPYEVLDASNGICQCVCAPGFGGPDCTDFVEGNCEEVFCVNGGTKRIYDDYCYCECPPNFGGEICEIPLTQCAGVECPTGQAPDPEDNCTCK